MSFSEHFANVDVILKLTFPEEKTDNGEVKDGASSHSQEGFHIWMRKNPFPHCLLSGRSVSHIKTIKTKSGQQNFYKGQGVGCISSYRQWEN